MIMIPPQLENKTSIEMLQLPCDPFQQARSPGISPPRPASMTASGMRLPKVPEIVNIKSRSEGQHSPAHHHYNNSHHHHDGAAPQFRNLGVPQLNRTSSESSMSSLFSAPVSKKEEMITAPQVVNTSNFMPTPPTLFDGNQDSLFRDIFVSIPQNQAPAIHVSEKDASEEVEEEEDFEFSSGCKSKRSEKRDAKTPAMSAS